MSILYGGLTELLQKYIWLVQTFIRAGENGLNLEEICHRWENRFDSPYSFEQVLMLEMRRIQRTGGVVLITEVVTNIGILF